MNTQVPRFVASLEHYKTAHKIYKGKLNAHPSIISLPDESFSLHYGLALGGLALTQSLTLQPLFDPLHRKRSSLLFCLICQHSCYYPRERSCPHSAMLQHVLHGIQVPQTLWCWLSSGLLQILAETAVLGEYWNRSI